MVRFRLQALRPTVGLLAAASSSETIRQAVADAAARLDLQLAMPSPEPPPWHPSLPGWVGWVVIGVIAAVLAYGIGGYLLTDVLPFWRRRGRLDWAEAPPTGDGAAAMPASAIDAADALAADGRIADAMHRLLLGGLAALRDRPGAALADSLTSREILRRASLPEPARAALRDMILRVEVTHFGARPTSAHDYAACRARFAELADALALGRTP